MSVLLLSGGMDSALCLSRYGAELAIGFDYGQPHVIELEYAERISARYGVEFQRRVLPDMPRVDDVVFAGRNAVMLSAAAAIAQERGVKYVVIGCNFSDSQRFPDCRPEFIRGISSAFQSAYGVTVRAPLLTMTKAQIVAESIAVGLPETWTCYSPLTNGERCLTCYSCRGLMS